MAVAQFKTLAAHRIAVLALYRELLRSVSQIKRSAHVGGNPAVRYETSRALQNTIVSEFRRYKPSIAAWSTRENLVRATELYGKLASIISAKGEASEELVRILDEVNQQKAVQTRLQLLRKPPEWKKEIPHNVKPSVDFAKDHAEMQRQRALLKKYLYRTRRLQGPVHDRDIDINEPSNKMLLEKALFKLAKRKLKHIEKVIATGPYTPGITYRSITKKLTYYYLRQPWRQNSKVGSIFRACRDYFTIIAGYKNRMPDYCWYAKWEGEWEYQLLGSQNSKLRGELVDSWCLEHMRELTRAKKRTKYYLGLLDRSRVALHSLQKIRQAQLAKLHSNKRKRFLDMQTYIQEHNIGPHSKPSLMEVLVMFKFK